MEIYRLTQEEIQAKIDEIYAEFPVLKGVDPAEYCCGGCAYNELGYDHGWDTADAWMDLQDCLYLLA